jgi:hypothetical protein
MEKKHNIVYRTTNLINGKIYIGVHSTNKLEDGYIGNGIYSCNDATKKYLFHKAVRKYGYENFKREVLRDFSTAREAYDYEKEMVGEVFVGRNDTYNIALGGSGGVLLSGYRLLLYRMDLRDRGFNQVMSKETRDKISKSRLGTKMSKESRAKMSKSRTGMKFSDERNKKVGDSKRGVKLNLSEEVVSEMSRKCTETFSNVPKSDSHKAKLSKVNDKNKMAVIKLSLDGKELCRYESVADAGRHVGCPINKLGKVNASAISGACNGSRKTYRGFKWKYALNEVKSTRKPVNKIDFESGSVLETYESVRSAARSMDVDNNLPLAATKISNACTGKIVAAYGFKWEFANK